MVVGTVRTKGGATAGYESVLGDLWDRFAGVFERIGDVSVYRLALALALKTAESAFIGLRGGARAGRDGCDGRHLPDEHPRIAGRGLAATTAAQALFFTAVSVVMLIGVAVALPNVVSKSSPSDGVNAVFMAAFDIPVTA